MIEAPTVDRETTNNELAKVFLADEKRNSVALLDGARQIGILSSDGEVEFVACYADLNNFKPFNDQYGYWRGDEMIRLVAKIAVEHCDPQRDFVGHVGGDDFIILYQSANWESQCQKIIEKFSTLAVALFDASAREAGGIHAEDRYGVSRFFPMTRLSIGAVKIHHNR